MAAALTIYIPFYKGINQLKEAVNSVLHQHCPNWSLKIMDDCGPDGQEACNWIDSLKDSRITYKRNRHNLGMVGNWNACLDDALQCDAKLVTLLHDDDRLLPNYCDLMLQQAVEFPRAALYFCSAKIIDRQGKTAFSFPDYVKKFIAPKKSQYVLAGDASCAQLLKGCFIMCPTVCYNLFNLGTLRFTAGLKQVQDLEFYLRVLEAGHTMTGTTQIAYEYRRHTNNATAQQTANLIRFEEEVSLYSEWAILLGEVGFKKASSVAEHKTIIKLNLMFCLLQDALHLRFAAFQKKASFLFTRLVFSQTKTRTLPRSPT